MTAIVMGGAFVAQVVRITAPYALAAAGGVVSERAGVINIALEGMLLVGALCAALGAHVSGSVLGGAAAGALGGAALAVVYALVVVRWRGDQIVAGVAINLLAVGLTRVLLQRLFGSASSSPPIVGFGGDVLLEPLLWIVVVVLAGVHAVVGATAAGLRLRAVGEHPEAAAVAGVHVARVRAAAVVAAGALAGLGGGWLALSSGGFTAEMSNGRGYVALAAVIMGGWRPGAAVAACLVFGVAEAAQVNLQAATGAGVPTELIQAAPYLLTMITLAGFVGRSRAPAALGEP